ncbi:hypothetical protein H0H92_015628 [Tricholoma furcatifolium]|nr:hypothetical protein H0H92_015628 [Tricholoma furcatifolium]
MPILLRNYSLNVSQDRKNTRRTRIISTLQPHLLKPTDFMDISGKVTACVFHGETRLTVLEYSRINKKQENQFPPNTHGFLYYHHIPNTPSTSAEVRFRVTPADDKFNFSAGEDLLMPRKYWPWSRSLCQLAGKSHKGLWDWIRQEGLVEDAAAKWALDNAKYPPEQILFYLEQPFVMDLQHRSVSLGIATPHAIGKVMLERLTTIRRGSSTGPNLWNDMPFRGHLLLRFERSSLPEHTNSRFLVLRVLKILQPIIPTAFSDDKTGVSMLREGVGPRRHAAGSASDNVGLPIPKEGELLQRRAVGGWTTSIFSINLDLDTAMYKDLNFLA